MRDSPGGRFRDDFSSVARTFRQYRASKRCRANATPRRRVPEISCRQRGRRSRIRVLHPLLSTMRSTMFTAARIARIALVAALLGGVALALAPVGYRLGWWELHFAFYYGLGGGLFASCRGLLLALGAVILALGTQERRGLALALAAGLLGVFGAGLPAPPYATA